MLTADDEKHLSQLFQLGVQLKTQFEVLEKAHNFTFAVNEIVSKLEISQPQLLLLVRQGEIAKRILARANSRLVYRIADLFRRRGTSMGDLIRYASEGLFKAIDRFDPERGFRFSTYATWWIKQGVMRNLFDKETALLDLQRRIGRFEEKFRAYHGRRPTIDEVSEGVHASMKKIKEALTAVKVRTISLDAPAYSRNGKSSKLTIQDITPSKEPLPDAVLDTAVDNIRFARLLQTVPKRDSEILYQRFGLDGLGARSISQLSTTFNMSKADILRLEKDALLDLQLTNFD